MPVYQFLPTAYSVRPPTEADIPALLELLMAQDLAYTGHYDVYVPDDILLDWVKLDLERDAWLISAANGAVAGYGTLSYREDTGRFLADGYVHPKYEGHGVGTTLLVLMEARAAAIVPTIPEGTRLVLINNIIASSESARLLLERHHYQLARVYFRMTIELKEPPPPAQWPEGISVRTSDGSPEDLRLAYETIEEGFRDHWAHAQRSFEDWKLYLVRENFDPNAWFFVEENSKVAGVALCVPRDENQIWIDQLTILRPWRKRGLGMALLYHAFNVFYQRGAKEVALGVDGQSLTGAQRLYERVGMHTTMQIGRYEKELRPGKDLMPTS